VIAVGTTALRVLETAALAGPGPWRGATDLFVRPGHRFRAVEGLMTNFHLPRSTLLMLVSALMGRERILALYAHAIAERYRFYSYGDATLLIP
jgi:S-adenosylmethionine:tRNA ribosyltransferase-isomerase